jgi:hypothetical protein
MKRTVSSWLLGSLPQPAIVWTALVYLFPEAVSGWARSKMMTVDESSLSGWEFRGGDRLPASTFAELDGIMGLHKNLHFLCQAWDDCRRRQALSIGATEVILPQTASDGKSLTAVLHGVGTSRTWQAEVGNNAYAFAAKRLKVYTKLDNWHYFGAGWTNRTAELLEVAGA